MQRRCEDQAARGRSRRRLTLLLAGPSCVHFSQARGGKPVSDQQRSGAWEIIKWCRELHVENVLVENVPEFLTWGPVRQRRDKETGELLFATEKHDLLTPGEPLMEPDPAYRGHFFRLWVRKMEELGYTVDHRILCAAHYGDATTRKRLFIQCKRSGRITWPKASHHSASELHAFPGTLKWRPAREIIDWSLPSTSIYGRKRPLAPNTLRRIYAGLAKFCGLPFITPNFGEREGQQPRTHGVDDPLPTVTGAGAGNLCQPFLVVLKGTQERQLDKTFQSMEEPLPTIHGNGGHFAVCEPFIYKANNRGDGTPNSGASINDPLPTAMASRQNLGVVQAFVVPVTHAGGPDRSHDIEHPLPTITTAHRGEFALVEPYLVNVGGPSGMSREPRSVDDPLSTLLAQNHTGLVQPFLVSYYGCGKGAHSVGDPLDTVTTRDRFGLVEAELKELLDKGDRLAVLDIRFRMLQPHELAAAHSFPADYFFAGGREDKVKQVGNSWPVRLATALCLEMLSPGGVPCTT